MTDDKTNVTSQHAARHPHISSIKAYLTVFAALLALTLLTVWVSHLDLKENSIYAAMGIAFIKAGLVSAFFMHLKYDDRFNTFVFTSSLIFLAIFFGLTFIDLNTRDWVLEEQGNSALRQDKPLNIQYKKPEARQPPPPTATTGSAGLAAPESQKPELYELGKSLFNTHCFACHQTTGLGIPGAFPPLVDSEYLKKDPRLPIKFVLHGLQGPIVVKGMTYNSMMPPLGAALNDKDIAAVLTYVRSEWADNAGAVDPDTVKEMREKFKSRTAPWTLQEAKE